MHTRKKIFKWVYLIYVAILAALVFASLMYVRSLLKTYEASQPEACVQNVMEQLTAAAAEGTFAQKYSIPQALPGVYEPFDPREKYFGCYTGEDLSFSRMPGHCEEDELCYAVKSGDFTLAEIKLKAAGPPVTKLAIFSYREWAVEYVRPVFETHEYTLTLPSDLSVRVNGIDARPSDGRACEDGMTEYTFSGIYLEPVFEITDREGNAAAYLIKDNRVISEIYHYSLTLPAALTVTLNGGTHRGEAVGERLVRHDIVLCKKPDVTISDHYGNTVSYEGVAGFPLTYVTIDASGGHTVTVGGNAVPEQDIEGKSNPDYEPLTEYVPNLPNICTYDIAVLKEDAEIAVRDREGKLMDLEPGRDSYDFTALPGLENVPDQVAAEVDVLEIARMWSLFMSNDLKFSRLSPYLVRDSYQYKVAYKYATNIDITFISRHALLDPAFTEEKATNFVWITDDCFSVDISFVKHMLLLSTGQYVDDAMNDRFYFVRYDDTNDKVDNPKWKLVSMKEILNGTENETENKTGNGSENGTGNENENGTGNENENGTGNGIERETGNRTENETGNRTENETGNRTENGTGNETEE